MKRILPAVMAILVCGVAHAGEGDGLARVERVYARAAEGVLMERVAGASDSHAQLWAEVRFSREQGGDLRLVRLNPRLDARPGDLVDVKLAPSGRIPQRMQVAPIREVTRAVAVAARRDSEMARAFDSQPATQNAVLALLVRPQGD